MSTWPSKFVILKDNFQEVLGNRIISSNMDVGPAKKRRRTKLISFQLNFSMMLSQDVYDEFKDFYYDNDVSVFDFKRPDTNKIVQARFLDVPSTSYSETMWIVGVQLELLP